MSTCLNDFSVKKIYIDNSVVYGCSSTSSASNQYNMYGYWIHNLNNKTYASFHKDPTDNGGRECVGVFYNSPIMNIFWYYGG